MSLVMVMIYNNTSDALTPAFKIYYTMVIETTHAHAF
jgi:hypothetical protein